MEFSNQTETVIQAMLGESNAWALLYNANYPFLFAKALNICGNTPDAKDHVQETFVIAFLHLAQLKDPSAFNAWITKILIHKCYKSIKRQKGLNLVENLPLEKDNHWENEIETTFDLLSGKIHLFHALDKLPEVLRSALMLRYFSAYSSYESMALILGSPVGTIRSRLNQAKVKLKEYWNLGHPDMDKAFNDAEEWNAFYNLHFANIHFSSIDRDRLLAHLEDQVEMIFTSGRIGNGKEVLALELEEDIRHGNYFGNLNITSSNNISIIETQNINSNEFPDRCPENSIMVVYRRGSKINRFRLHNSPA